MKHLLFLILSFVALVSYSQPRFELKDCKQISAVPNQDGRVELIFIGGDDLVYHISQFKVNDDWGQPTLLANKAAKQISVSKNQNGKLIVFFIGMDNNVYHLTQIAANGPNGWTPAAALSYPEAFEGTVYCPCVRGYRTTCPDPCK